MPLYTKQASGATAVPSDKTINHDYLSWYKNFVYLGTTVLDSAKDGK